MGFLSMLCFIVVLLFSFLSDRRKLKNTHDQFYRGEGGRERERGGDRERQKEIGDREREGEETERERDRDRR